MTGRGSRLITETWQEIQVFAAKEENNGIVCQKKQMARKLFALPRSLTVCVRYSFYIYAQTGNLVQLPTLCRKKEIRGVRLTYYSQGSSHASKAI